MFFVPRCRSRDKSTVELPPCFRSAAALFGSLFFFNYLPFPFCNPTLFSSPLFFQNPARSPSSAFSNRRTFSRQIAVVFFHSLPASLAFASDLPPISSQRSINILNAIAWQGFW